MNDYLVEIGPDKSIEGITILVQGEEAGASEFKASSVSSYGGKVTNLAKFSELPPGEVPRNIQFQLNSTELPQGTTEVWAGVMIVNGKATAVIAFR